MLIRPTALTLAVVALTASCTAHSSPARRVALPRPAATTAAASGGWSPPQGYRADPQQVGFALVSADGRHITATATGGGCTRDAHLGAVESPGRVVLRLSGITPADITGGCTADLLLLTRSTTLAAPLGHRSLYDASTGRRVRWFDGRRLAAPRWLPPGAAVPKDHPVRSGWDRSYAFPGHRSAAPVDITQTPTRRGRPPYTPSPMLAASWTAVHGRSALLVVQRDDAGRLVQDQVSWVERGYLLSVASSPQWAWQRPMPTRELMRVATGLRLPGG